MVIKILIACSWCTSPARGPLHHVHYGCIMVREVQEMVRTVKDLYISPQPKIRPLLEYASKVWSPCTVAEISKVESVQRSFTKRLPGLNSCNYCTRLCILEIESLQLRRLRSDLIYVYKMLFGLVDLNFTDYFTLRADSVTRGHKYKLLKLL